MQVQKHKRQSWRSISSNRSTRRFGNEAGPTGRQSDLHLGVKLLRMSVGTPAVIVTVACLLALDPVVVRPLLFQSKGVRTSTRYSSSRENVPEANHFDVSVSLLEVLGGVEVVR